MDIKKTISYYDEDFNRRCKYSVKDQIQNMKDHGISFNIYDEDYAYKYLCDNSYYFKIKAYEKLYFKNNDGKYINLDFAYLKDLATIDCYIRKEIMSISLDIEHFLKTKLLNDFNASKEDGYSIVADFISTNPDHYKEEIASKRNGKACSNLIAKYENNFALWNFIEVLSFGDFKELYQFFYLRNPGFKESSKLSYFINPVRILRNAAAHNNCLLQSLTVPYVCPDDFNRNYAVNTFLGAHGLSNKTLITNLNKPLVHDFCVLLHLYYQVVPLNSQKYMWERLAEKFDNRFAYHKNYYKTNTTICSAYIFVRKVINVYLELTQKIC